LRAAAQERAKGELTREPVPHSAAPADDFIPDVPVDDLIVPDVPPDEPVRAADAAPVAADGKTDEATVAEFREALAEQGTVALIGELRAVYEDAINDEWPTFALEKWAKGTSAGTVQAWRLYDGDLVYSLAGGPQFGNTANYAPEAVTGVEAHETGFVPVVRYLGTADPDGDVLGEVWPLIVYQDQLDGSTFSIEMAQALAVHRQKWATGLGIETDDNGQPIEPFRMGMDRLLVAEDPDSKFGEFGQTDISAWLNGREDTRRAMAIKSQLPPGHMLGEMANLSAEALAATEAPQQRRSESFRSNLGESHEQAFRLDALQAKDTAGWLDTSAQVVWADTESRSLSQVVDALGKAASLLGIPPRGLWEKSPGVTDGDLENWERMAVEDATRRANIAASAYGMGAVEPADPDSDADPDR
jgi:hypothetical protein